MPYFRQFQDDEGIEEDGDVVLETISRHRFA